MQPLVQRAHLCRRHARLGQITREPPFLSDLLPMARRLPSLTLPSLLTYRSFSIHRIGASCPSHWLLEFIMYAPPFHHHHRPPPLSAHPIITTTPSRSSSSAHLINTPSLCSPHHYYHILLTCSLNSSGLDVEAAFKLAATLPWTQLTSLG